MAEKAGNPGNFCMWVGNRAIHDIAFSQFIDDLGHTQTVPSLGVKHHALLGALTLCGVRPKNPLDPIEVSVLYIQLRLPYGGAGGVATPSSVAVETQSVHLVDGGGAAKEGGTGENDNEIWGKFVVDGKLPDASASDDGMNR